MLDINPALVSRMLEHFLREEIHKTGFSKAVLGLSGGVDSAVVAALLVRSLGPANVHALIMPYRSSHPDSRNHAELLANQLGISFDIIDISAMIDAFFEQFPEADSLRRGNRMARERMCLLYDYSQSGRALVIGTSNKTELLLGYGTIFGDLASAINPIGDLYKTQIWQLAEYLAVPEVIIKKAPSADLWDGQTDEAELGYTYRQLDELLYYMVDYRYSDELLRQKDFPEKMIAAIRRKLKIYQFKRRPPVIAKVSIRTINQDFRYCRDWGV